MVISDTRHTPADRREQLLNVARVIFAQRGYQATTMDDVATAAGFTKPILYQHFASKESLYNEIVQGASTQLLEGLAAVREQTNSSRAMVDAAFRLYFEAVVNETAAFRLLFLQPHVGEGASELRRVESRLVSFIESLIPLDSDPPLRRQVAASIVGMAEGAATAWLVQQENAGWPELADGEVDRLAGRISALAWGGLRSIDVN